MYYLIEIYNQETNVSSYKVTTTKIKETSEKTILSSHKEKYHALVAMTEEGRSINNFFYIENTQYYLPQIESMIESMSLEFAKK